MKQRKELYEERIGGEGGGRVEEGYLDGLRMKKKAKRDSKKEAGIKQIMNTENSKRNWNILNHVVNDPRPPPLTSIGRLEAGNVVRYDTREGVHEVMEDECIKRYNVEKGAPIMNTEMTAHADINEANLHYLRDVLMGVK